MNQKNQKNQNNYTSPDIKKLQEVVIDFRTKIYVAIGVEPAEAKKRYLLKHGGKIY